MSEITYFTFIYCKMHDDGFIIKGNHLYVPDEYCMQHSDECDSSDWCNMGVIRYDGSGFDIVENLRIDYDRYFGGFTFSCYTNTLTDEEGNMIENELLDKWIEDVEKN
jgi:hypothetical protein